MHFNALKGPLKKYKKLSEEAVWNAREKRIRREEKKKKREKKKRNRKQRTTTTTTTKRTGHWLTQRMEKEPWYTRVEGPFPEWQGPVGVKEDGGGSTYAQGKVGEMVIHRAVNNQDVNGEWVVPELV